MKIVLLMLSGEPTRALEELQRRHPNSTVETIGREMFQFASPAQRVRMVRALHPDIFAIATERLVWQRGANAFLLLGALAGAHRSVILDVHGGWREEPRANSLLAAPVRIARETAVSGAAFRRAEGELRRLEAALERREHRDVTRAQWGSAEPRIVYVRSSPGPGTPAGGAATHINGFLGAALNLGACVSLISNDDIAGLDQTKLPVKIIWPDPVGSSRAAFDVYNNLRFTEAASPEIERLNPDFIYQRYARFSWSGVAASLRAKRPLFLEYNGSEVWVGQHWDRVDKLDLLLRYEHLNLKGAARIFVVSDVERRQLLSQGIEDRRIVVNPNGVDVDLFKPGIGGEKVRNQFAIARDEILVGFVGTFGPWHGVEMLADAIRRMPQAEKLKWLFVGGGALRTRVEGSLHAAGLTDSAIFTGVVSHAEVPPLLDACDILVSPHVPLAGGREFFGSPTKLFEYMAMGKAIVASRLGQIAEALTDGETALLVQPGNVDELAVAITRLAESRPLREQLGNAARAAAVAHHTWMHNAKRIIDAYAHWAGENN